MEGTRAVKVSVIIPVFGKTPYLTEALAALEAAKVEDMEVILAEPPATVQDAGTARNVGLERAKGEWVMFLDADDLPRPDWIRKTVALGEKTGADVVVASAEKFDVDNGRRAVLPNLAGIAEWADGKAHRLDELGAARFTTLGLAPWNKAVRREVIERYGIRFQSIARSNDLAFTVELLAAARTFAVVNDILIDYRVNHSTSLQSGNAKSPLAGLKALREARHRLRGRYAEAYRALWMETVAYNIRASVLTLIGRGY